MGCKSDLVKTGVFGALGAYGLYKALTWRHTFWILCAGGVSAISLYETYKNGVDANKSCKIKKRK